MFEWTLSFKTLGTDKAWQVQWCLGGETHQDRDVSWLMVCKRCSMIPAEKEDKLSLVLEMFSAFHFGFAPIELSFLGVSKWQHKTLSFDFLSGWPAVFEPL